MLVGRHHTDEKSEQGFSITELIIAIGIVGIIASFGLPSYFKYRKQTIINGDSGRMVEYFREGIARARSQQDGSAWAFYIVNDSSDYYALIRDGATSTPVTITYLGTGVEFTATSTAGVINITGGPALTPLSSTVNVGLQTTDVEFTDEITVNTNGKIIRTKNY